MAAALVVRSMLCFGRMNHPSLPPSSSSSRLRVSTTVSGASSPALGFGRSELFGSPLITTSQPSLLSHRPRPPIRPIIAHRICPFTGKKGNRANKISFSNHKTKKLQRVNLQTKRIWWEAGKRYLKLRLSTKALRTIEKNGLDAVAKQAGVDLRKK